MRTTKRKITQAELKSKYAYDPETGVFSRRLSDNRLKPTGSLVNAPTGNPYLKVMIEGAQYSIPRLIWLYVYGTFPANRLSFLDGDGLNTKINNITDKRIKVQGSSAPRWNGTERRWMVVKNNISFKYRNYNLAVRKANEVNV